MSAFTAVAHPTRRSVLDLLVQRDLPAGDLVAAFPHISQPAVSRHLRVLRNAGLVSVRVQAQQRIYSLQPKALTELDSWVAKYQEFWPDRLDALERHLSKKSRKGLTNNEISI
jgi:DNA-binding transcriptional ArsR family regulator